jgi:hypothetical protein
MNVCPSRDGSDRTIRLVGAAGEASCSRLDWLVALVLVGLGIGTGKRSWTLARRLRGSVGPQDASAFAESLRDALEALPVGEDQTILAYAREAVDRLRRLAAFAAAGPFKMVASG